jgi:purine-binding chemotaxis protein CheW
VAGAAAAGATSRDLLGFSAGGRDFALPAAEVAAIVRPPPITRVPLAPASLLGVANVRGSMLPVVSLAGLLGLAPQPPTPASRVVVVAPVSSNGGGGRAMGRLGLLVDAVRTVTRRSDDETLDLPALLAEGFGGLPRRAPAASETADRPTGGAAAARQGPARRALLTLVAGGQEYALPLERVGDIVALPASSVALPGAAAAMAGMIAVRDEVLPLVSLRALLGMPQDDFDRRAARVIVTEAAGHGIALVVDGVRGILRVAGDAIDPVPPVLSRGRGEARIGAVCRLDGGARLLAILAPDGLFDDATLARLAAMPQGARAVAPAAANGETERCVAFAAGSEQYGLPVDAVAEVLRCPETLTAVPRAPRFVAGLMSWRGAALPVLDLRQQFGAPAAPARGAKRRVVVLAAAGVRAGVLAEGEPALLALPRTELAELPELRHRGSQIFGRVAMLDGGDRMMMLIDPSRLLAEAAQEILLACRQAGSFAEAAAPTP